MAYTLTLLQRLEHKQMPLWACALLKLILQNILLFLSVKVLVRGRHPNDSYYLLKIRNIKRVRKKKI
jgi:hypothetical protein